MSDDVELARHSTLLAIPGHVAGFLAIRDMPPSDLVLEIPAPGEKPMTPRRRKPRRMDCNSARRYNDTHCGPQAQHFAARGYPAWLWPAGSIIGGSAACFLLLMFLFSHLPPAHAAEQTLD